MKTGALFESVIKIPVRRNWLVVFSREQPTRKIQEVRVCLVDGSHVEQRAAAMVSEPLRPEPGGDSRPMSIYNCKQRCGFRQSHEGPSRYSLTVGVGHCAVPQESEDLCGRIQQMEGKSMCLHREERRIFWFINYLFLL